MENENQPAFPISGSFDDDHPEIMVPLEKGLSKREYFAGLAMQAVIANSAYDKLQTANNAARLAVDYADALLGELALK